MKLSAIVLTKNEEENINRCLKSLDFCDEIIIVDDYSTDETISQIENIKNKILPKLDKTSDDKLEIKIFQKKLNDDFSSQRNFAMEKARGEWILFLDADEEVSFDLKNEIKKIIEGDNQIKAYYIKRRDFWWGRELKFGEVLKVRNQGLIRLVKKNSGLWQGKIHEKFILFSKKFKTAKLKNFINHFPHQSIKEFLKEINFYSTLRAKELLENGRKTNIFEITFFPLAKFLLNYFLYFGFLDGAAGFGYAFLMSFHSFLVRVKLYQYLIQEKK